MAHMLQCAQVVEDYLADPLNTTGKVPARTGQVLLNAFRCEFRTRELSVVDSNQLIYV
jgi:hypothetical protein